MKNVYKKEFDWSGFTVHESKKGWVVKFWSRIQGSYTGSKYLVPFSVIPAGADLEDYENGTAKAMGQNMGDYLGWIANEYKCLNKGILVQ